MWSPPDKPGLAVLIYDGRCTFCERQSARLMRWVRRDSLVRVSFHEPGVLERYPALTREQCDRAMQLVLPDGRIVAGARAVAEAIRLRRRIGWMANVYYLPGLRWMIDRGYDWIARHRYRLAGGRAVCSNGSCTPSSTRR